MTRRKRAIVAAVFSWYPESDMLLSDSAFSLPMEGQDERHLSLLSCVPLRRTRDGVPDPVKELRTKSSCSPKDGCLPVFLFDLPPRRAQSAPPKNRESFFGNRERLTSEQEFAFHYQDVSLGVIRRRPTAKGLRLQRSLFRSRRAHGSTYNLRQHTRLSSTPDPGL